ncbi:hypothetical protein P8452_69395 [Trifolium repens]|nr:hypothetical protein P8452_69395 [Trifolium repens]
MKVNLESRPNCGYFQPNMGLVLQVSIYRLFWVGLLDRKLSTSEGNIDIKPCLGEKKLFLTWLNLLIKVFKSSLLVDGGRQVTGTLKGYDQLLNLVLDEAVEFLRVAIVPMLSSSFLYITHGNKMVSRDSR